MDQASPPQATPNNHSRRSSKSADLDRNAKGERSWRRRILQEHRKTVIVAGAVLTAGVIAAIIAGVLEYTKKANTQSASISSLHSDVTIWFNNDLHGDKSNNTDGAIVLSGPSQQQDASRNCSSIGERLLDPNSIQSAPLFNYLAYLDDSTTKDLYWVANKTDGRCNAISQDGQLLETDCTQSLPALCGSSASIANVNDQDNSDKWRIIVDTQGQSIRGYRDKRSFRFQGIRYAPQPVRFNHSTLFTDPGSYDALSNSQSCVQSGTGDMSEDCLFLNVFTPYLPSDSGNSSALKPVVFWIHGGAFEVDSGTDPTFDGGNYASRGDVVTVIPNYRLGNLGFLVVENTTATGNYGFGDQITALDWIQEHIRDFGGDPARVTVAGQSAGAASVRAMLGSPKATEKFAAGIMQSNLGGYDFAKPYSQYYSQRVIQSNFTDSIVSQVNCDGHSPLPCLLKTDAQTLTSVQQAAFLVQDNIYITESQLILNKTAPVANVPLIMGTMQGDAVFFIAPEPDQANLTSALDGAGYQEIVVNNTRTFPVPQSGNTTDAVYNVTVNAANDAMFRCVDQATASSGMKNKIFPNIWYYEMERAYINYPTRPACNAPKNSSFPNGDPEAQTYDCHTGDTVYTWGNVAYNLKPDRDGMDILFSQQMLDYWTSFIRTHDPNPDSNYLEARGYNDTINANKRGGPWAAVDANDPTKRLLSATNPQQVGFTEIDQCADLELPITMFD